jgi:hypothetical protein
VGRGAAWTLRVGGTQSVTRGAWCTRRHDATALYPFYFAEHQFELKLLEKFE